MEFLPLEIDGDSVYVGFWKRVGAGILDIIIIIPILYLLFEAQSMGFIAALIIGVIGYLIFSIYSVYFNAMFGGTIGKLIVGIRITKPNGSKIGLKEAMLRSSVDILFGLCMAFIGLTVLFSAGQQVYLSLSPAELDELIYSAHPVWQAYVDSASSIWYLSEFIILLLNERKRSLHDFIAGTVVIKKKFVVN